MKQSSCLLPFAPTTQKGMINYVTICFNAIHKTFTDETEFKVEGIDESKRVKKFSRAVLRTLKIDVELVDNFELVKCNCGGVGRQVEEEEQIIQSDMKIKHLGWVEGDRFFLRKKEQTEISERQGEYSVVRNKVVNSSGVYG